MDPGALLVVTDLGEIVKVATSAATGFRVVRMGRCSWVLEVDFRGEESCFFIFHTDSDGALYLKHAKPSTPVEVPE